MFLLFLEQCIKTFISDQHGLFDCSYIKPSFDNVDNIGRGIEIKSIEFARQAHNQPFIQPPLLISTKKN